MSNPSRSSSGSIAKRLYPLLRKALFCMEPEKSHHAALNGLNMAHRLGLSRLMAAPAPSKPVTTLGLTFPNPVGLAAGLDKNGDYIDALGSLGFGFLEIGTITPKPQPGNPKPRLFRLVEEQAIINRMGFNNLGVDHLVAQVRASRYQQQGGVLGINIGKNISTPVERAVDDYLICLDKVYEHADYIVVNISSPNTPGLRTLQYGDALSELLAPLKERQLQLEGRFQRRVPLVVKIAPDMNEEEVGLVAEQLLAHELDGVTATNTTSGRVGVESSRWANEAGGLSGRPLTAHSTTTLSRLAMHIDGRMAIIGVGGIMAGSDAVSKWRAGADLVQLYSGFIYAGSPLIAECVEAYV